MRHTPATSAPPAHAPGTNVIHQVWAAMTAASRDLARLVIPVACAGCGTWDLVWCAACASVFDTTVRRVEAGAGRLDRLDDRGPIPVWALALYAGAARETILAWKDRYRVDLDRPIAAAAFRAGVQVAPVVNPTGTHTQVRVLVVAAPSSGKARRRRGRDHVRVVARAFAAGLSTQPGVCAVVPRHAVLRKRGRTDQVGQGSRGRGNRLGEVCVTRAGRASAAGAICLVVDDVLTTGATLAACETALAGAGATVMAGFVLAATPGPGHAVAPAVAATDLGRGS